MTAQEKLAPLAAKLHAALADEKQRVNLLVCTGLAGLVLLGVTAWLPAGNSTQSPQTVQTDTAADYATQLESRLTALISRIEGAGKTAVMVTLESGSESIYATDTDADGASTHVLLGSGRADGLVETVQTPQVFDAGLLKAALQSALTEHAALTDDCSAVERLGKAVYLTDGDEENIKITTPLDLIVAEAILRRREEREAEE